MVKTCPIDSYGGSTGRAPIQVNNRTFPTNNQKIILGMGYDELDEFFRLIDRGSVNKIKIENIRAITPPSLSGIERKIA